MSTLPTTPRLLLGPGPSPVLPRVLEAMTAPQRSHLDPDMVALLDDVRRRLHGLFNVGDGGIALAVSGTGSSGLETAIANVVAPGDRVLSIVTGYFGERLAQVAERYGADVTRLTGEWGRAIDPEQVRTALEHGSCQVVTVVHAETSTGVLQPVRDVAALARAHGALVVVDAVTSLGAHPVDVDGWGLDVVYSCSQKGLGAPSGLAPIAFNAAARTRATSRSFYLDLPLLEGYWVKRGYHHTISTPLIYALHEALRVIDEETMPARAARHERVHGEFVAALGELGLSLLPPEGERLWTLNAVRIPESVTDEAKVRVALRDQHGIEIGAGLGPLAGKVWRIGLMGAGATSENVGRLTNALEAAISLGR
ncbi:MAG: alanine--glyoxylate aminotransferase family protein [Acidobacteria bacterium]|nr:alanine--glyoxylate aminotransferase family protein [Acidobacteriota bacterium]